jgi:hypothetical protein
MRFPYGRPAGRPYKMLIYLWNLPFTEGAASIRNLIPIEVEGSRFSLYSYLAISATRFRVSAVPQDHPDSRDKHKGARPCAPTRYIRMKLRFSRSGSNPKSPLHPSRGYNVFIAPSLNCGENDFHSKANRMLKGALRERSY